MPWPEDQEKEESPGFWDEALEAEAERRDEKARIGFSARETT